MTILWIVYTWVYYIAVSKAIGSSIPRFTVNGWFNMGGLLLFFEKIRDLLKESRNITTPIPPLYILVIVHSLPVAMSPNT